MMSLIKFEGPPVWRDSGEGPADSVSIPTLLRSPSFDSITNLNCCSVYKRWSAGSSRGESPGYSVPQKPLPSAHATSSVGARPSSAAPVVESLHGSVGIVQVLTTKCCLQKQRRIPYTAVSGLFKSELFIRVLLVLLLDLLLLLKICVQRRFR